jgi:speckle-type POZ protein
VWRTSDGKRVRVTRSHSTDEPTGHEKWGSLFIKKSHLKELLLRSNDRFTIRCVLTIIKRPCLAQLKLIQKPAGG